jgi:hypothetical protein
VATVLNPFAVLGLPAEYGLTGQQISRAYLARISGAHPDAGEEDDVVAAGLNEARRVLENPETRAAALLALRGDEAGGASKELPRGFLAAMMGTREEVEEALASGDEGARARWQAWAAVQRGEYEGRVARLFAQGAETVEIRRELNAWRYIERLIEQLDPNYDPGRADFGSR